MNLDELKSFCGVACPHPFSWGEHSFAMDGHTIVRVQKIEGISEDETMQAGIDRVFSPTCVATGAQMLQPVPRVDAVKTKPCPNCDGTGRAGVCPECDGKGEIEFVGSVHDYVVVCKSCSGSGEIWGGETVCEHCSGTGVVPVKSPVKIGDVEFADIKLRALQDLPGFKLAPMSVDGLNYFRFDGGDGFTMPLNPDRWRGDE